MTSSPNDGYEMELTLAPQNEGMPHFAKRPNGPIRSWPPSRAAAPRLECST